MSIYHHPTYLEFIKNEKKTLRHLLDSPRIKEDFPEIAEQANISFYNLPDKDLAKKDFAFQCDFNLYIAREERNVRIALEAQVRRDFSASNYVLSICANTEPPYDLIRKFHFDYVKSNINQSPKPVYHFQYGGESTPLLEKMGIDVEVLRPWLSNPRITFTQ